MNDKKERCAQMLISQYGMTCTNCSRKSGHGPGRKYCAQHALRYDKSEPTAAIWRIRRGREFSVHTAPKDIIERVAVRKIDAHTYIDAGGRRWALTDAYYRNFTTEHEAVAWTLSLVKQAVERAQDEAERGRRLAEALEKRLRRIER